MNLHHSYGDMQRESHTDDRWMTHLASESAGQAAVPMDKTQSGHWRTRRYYIYTHKYMYIYTYIHAHTRTRKGECIIQLLFGEWIIISSIFRACAAEREVYRWVYTFGESKKKGGDILAISSRIKKTRFHRVRVTSGSRLDAHQERDGNLKYCN